MSHSFIFVLLSVTTLIIALDSPLVIAGGNNEAKCRQWASEDGVPAHAIVSYTQKCIADQLAAPEPYPAPADEESATISSDELDQQALPKKEIDQIPSLP